MTGPDSTQRERAAKEKRLWLRLTRACNNRCLFCLDADVQDGQLERQEDLKNQIREGVRQGCQRLILSGGEPTLHPDYLQLVSFGKQAGFDWIQTITNGRMFAYRRFAEQAVAAGLSEVTVSMHGHTPELHDQLVAVEGAFRQSLQGLAHLQELGSVVSVDVVINALNIESMPELLQFYLDRGVREFDLLWMVPFGRAWKNRKQLFCDPEQAAPRLHQALALARQAGAVLWTNRLPPNLLEGFEDLIQDPHKLHDEVRGRRSEFEARLETGSPMICKDKERCRACFVRGLCESLEDKDPAGAEPVFASDPDQLNALLQKPDADIGILLNRRSRAWLEANADRLKEHSSRVLISLETFLTREETLRQGVNPAEALKPLAGSPVRLAGLPPCALPGAELVKQHAPGRPPAEDLSGRTDYYILHQYRVYALGCRACTARKRCPGMPINHVRSFGFGMLTPLNTP